MIILGSPPTIFEGLWDRPKYADYFEHFGRNRSTETLTTKAPTSTTSVVSTQGSSSHVGWTNHWPYLKPPIRIHSIHLIACSNLKHLWTSYVLRCMTTSEFGGVWCSKQSSEWSSGFEELHFGGIRGTATFLHSLSRTAEGMAAWPTSFLVTNSAWTILDKCWSCRTVVGQL